MPNEATQQQPSPSKRPFSSTHVMNDNYQPQQQSVDPVQSVINNSQQVNRPSSSKKLPPIPQKKIVNVTPEVTSQEYKDTL
jgi:hypothetical protein